MAEHPVFITPADPNVRIWRYMDFTKYVSMLEKRALYFSRADLLGDPFEGSFAKANAPRRAGGPIPQEKMAGLYEFYKGLRQWTFVNCWHMSDYESAAMWTIYARSERAIAIQSTYRRLDAAINAHENVFLGLVSYVDYDSQPIPENNSFYPYVYKRRSYEYEREIRAVTQELPDAASALADGAVKPPLGKEKGVDVESLIEVVYISPGSPEWYIDVTAAVTERFGFSIPVQRSSLDEKPFF